MSTLTCTPTGWHLPSIRLPSNVPQTHRHGPPLYVLQTQCWDSRASWGWCRRCNRSCVSLPTSESSRSADLHSVAAWELMAAGAWGWFLNILAINCLVWWVFYLTTKWQNTHRMQSAVCSETLKGTRGNSNCDERHAEHFGPDQKEKAPISPK
jgi:hypothetical protein